MCGRYALYGPRSRIRDRFDLDDGFDFGPRYNIAPTTNVLVVRPGSERPEGGQPLPLGLIPGWAKDGTMGAKLSNARAETVSEKPAFRTAFRRWRCIVPASGFSNGRPFREDGRTVKQPYFIRPRDETNCSGSRGSASGGYRPTARKFLVLHRHDRRQRVDDADPRQNAGHLGPGDYDAWLDPANVNAEMLRVLLCAAEADDMIAYPVSRAVNSSRTDAPMLVEPT